MNIESHSLSLVYLGKRGGGLNLYFDLMTSLEKESTPVKSFFSASLEKEIAEIKFITQPNFLYSPSKLRDVFKLRGLILGLKGLAFFIRLQKFEKVVFLMPSPFDLPLYFLARLKSLNIICCVHDLSAHPGETWPSSGAIKVRTRQASSLVAFSRPIAKALGDSVGKPVNLVSLPSTIPLLGLLSEDTESLILSMKTSQKVNVLLIGRIYKYKNAEMIARIASRSPDYLFCIAGQLNTTIQQTQNLLILDKWLSNIEFDLILSAADIVIFPYSEASQSGTIPLAIDHQKIIVAAGHPGFREQLDDYDRKTVFEPDSEEGCISALAAAGKILRQTQIDPVRLVNTPRRPNDLASLLLESVKPS